MNINPGPPLSEKKGIHPLIIIGVLFFVFGFVTWLGSVLIPYLRIACQLEDVVSSYLVAFAFYISYFIMALPSSVVLKYTGYKKGMALGLLIMAAGALLFIPAALSRTYSVFLIGLFVQGTGLSILQTASNPYVTILGPRESAAKRISIVGICNGIAGAVAPLILGAIVLGDADKLQNSIDKISGVEKLAALNALAHRVIMPYTIMVVLLALLAALVYFSKLPEIDTSLEDEATGISNKHKTNIFQFPHLVIGVITLFLYVGVEVIAGDTIINYGASLGIPMSTAKFFTSLTLVGMLIGYIVGIICIPKYFSQRQALKFSAFCALAFALGALFTSGYTSICFVALLGFANSLMWPSIWPLAIDGLGKFTKVGSSLLIMAIGGGAVLPLIYGKLADKYSFHQAYWLVVPCYVVIAYYAIRGYRVGK
ncbi:MAG: sugar MFS transporter [Bacteroidetes bacterium]|nr:sugar MFS transporter [Bacteroidota bacterium]